MTLVVVAGTAVASVAAFFGLTWYFRQTDPRLSTVPAVVAALIFGIGMFVAKREPRQNKSISGS